MQQIIFMTAHHHANYQAIAGDATAGGSIATAMTAGGSAGRLRREKSRKGKAGVLEVTRELKCLLRTGN